MISCTIRAREHRVTAFLKIVYYDKIKFPFLDILKNQTFDLI